MIKNPKAGFRLPDDIDHELILKIAAPYIKPLISKAVDWTPLKNLNTKYRFNKVPPSEEDVWQFTTFLLDPPQKELIYD
jgi:homospermidine synthase